MIYNNVEAAFYQCPFGRSSTTNAGYAKFMKDLVTKKRVVTFEDDDRMQHCSAIAQDLSYKRKKIWVRSLFLVQSSHYNLRKHYVIWGKV